MRLADGELRNVYRRQVLTDYESDFQCAITHLPTSNDFFEIFALGTLKMPTWAIFFAKAAERANMERFFGACSVKLCSFVRTR